MSFTSFDVNCGLPGFTIFHRPKVLFPQFCALGLLFCKVPNKGSTANEKLLFVMFPADTRRSCGMAIFASAKSDILVIFALACDTKNGSLFVSISMFRV